MNVPIHIPTFEKRKEIPDKVAQLMESWGASHLYGNIEYEVDELGRDEKIVRAAMVARETGTGWGGQVVFMKDFCLVGPGEVLSKVSCVSSVSHRTALTIPTETDWNELLSLLTILQKLVRQNPRESLDVHRRRRNARRQHSA